MKFSNIFLSAALVIATTASSLAAFEWDTLYQRGNWRLDINYYDNGSLSCESRTVNSQGYVFSLYTWDDGDYIIRFSHEDWSFGDTSQNQDFVVEIDRRGEWDISGTKFDGVIQTIVTPPASSLNRFFSEIRRGNTLYLRNDRGNEIARFSLSGTTATLNQHEICERRILNGVSRIDPFN
ncbi:MAG: hypothetical protein L3J33_07675 [Rhodobacteraceae bacterium]|nr:hypothetical protein [Paracoccaceae bacterium]